MKQRTMNEALVRAAEATDKGFVFVGDDGVEDPWPFSRLRDHACAVAASLRERGLRRGDRVALVLPAAAEFVPTFFGVLFAGGVPVPLYPPMGLGQLGGYLEHCQHIVGKSGAALLVTTGKIKAVLGKLHELVPTLRALLTPADLEGDVARYVDPGVTLDDTCFIQFTSGSTSRPKGVLVSHENLAHNTHAIMREGLRVTGDDRAVSWLPLFHDMGLIGFVMAPIQYPITSVFIPPLTFLKKPSVWITTMHRHRATLTFGPNFGYAITAKRTRDADLAGVDLSCVRLAGCGAEPIQAQTLRAFAERFGPYGWSVDKFVPSYGMAESTLAISFDYGLPVDRVEGEPLWAEGRAVPRAEGAEGTVDIVGCGGAFPGHGLRIVDPATERPLPERRVGEIRVKGPSVMRGYFDHPEATAAAFDAEGWLRTGDLGYLVDGKVFICGRQKDVLIVNGRNYAPHDLEWAASNVPGVRAGNVVAFPSHRPGLDREAVIVVAEVKDGEADRTALSAAVQAEIQRVTSLTVDEVHLVDAGTLPKTSSGKLQRSRARALFEEGALRRREDEGALQIAGRLAQSQLAHLKLAIFGRGGGKP